MIDQWLRKLSVRRRITGGFLILLILLALISPLVIANQLFLVNRLEQVTNIEARSERLLLLASSRIASSRINLNRYIQGATLNPEDARTNITEAIELLTEARPLATVAEQELQIVLILEALRDYQSLINELEAGDSQEVALLSSRASRLGDDAAQRIEVMVRNSETRIQAANDALLTEAQNRLVVLVIGLTVVLIVGFQLSRWLSQSITKPVAELLAGSQAFRQGHLDARITTTGTDELSQLAMSFNDMAGELSESYAVLEHRIAERTRALETSAEVSRRLSTILDTGELVNAVVTQIREAFGFYHAHIYLVDAPNNRLVMAGGTGEAGEILLRQGHALEIGRGLVGRAAVTETAVYVPNVGQDPTWLPNPLLPETRSEAAVPIMLRGQVIGVLDVQHNVAGALDESSVALLQSIANQVAIALDNARQLAETQENQQRLALVIGGTNDGVWDWDIPNNKVYFSPRWKEMIGYADHEISNDFSEYQNRLHPDDHDRMMQAVADYLEGKTNSYEHEFRLQHKDGSYHWILVRATLERDNEGNPLRMAGSHSDITDRKQAEATMQKQANQLQAVTEINTLALSISNSEEMLAAVTTQIVEKFKLYHAHIYLLEEDNLLRLAAGAGNVGQQMVQEGRTISLQQERSLVAQAARTAQAILINDVTTSPDHLPNPLLPHTKSELAVPLLIGNQVIGVLDVQADQVNFFTEVDINIQSTLANQLAASLQSIRALEQAAEAAARANALARRLTRTGWQELAAKSEKRMAYGYKQQKVIELAESAEDDITAGATLVQPLELQGEPIGTLALSEPQELTSEARDILTAVAERLSEHLENLRLTRQTEEALAQTETLYAGSALIVQATSPEEVLKAITTSTAMRRMERAAILYFDRPWDDDPAEITIRATWSLPGTQTALPVGATFPLAQFPIMHLIDRDKPTVLEDIANHKTVGDNLRNLFANLQINSLIGLPLIVGNRWFGIITAQSPRAIPALTEEDIRQIRSLVEQAATVLRTLQLLEEIQDQANLEQTLREITARVYAAPTAEAVLRTAAREANRILGLETFAYVDAPVPTQDTGPLGQNGKQSNGHSE